MMPMSSKAIYNYRHESQDMRHESAYLCFYARIDGIIGIDSHPDR